MVRVSSTAERPAVLVAAPVTTRLITNHLGETHVSEKAT